MFPNPFDGHVEEIQLRMKRYKEKHKFPDVKHYVGNATNAESKL